MVTDGLSVWSLHVMTDGMTDSPDWWTGSQMYLKT